MPYGEDLAGLFPAVLSAGAETVNQRSPFQVARRFQDVSECHCAASAAARLRPQKTSVVESIHRGRADTLSAKSGPVYSPLVKTAEIRVLEILPAKFEQQIRGGLHHVILEEGECPRENSKCPRKFAVSASEAEVVCYTALSYVVSLSWRGIRANEYI